MADSEVLMRGFTLEFDTDGGPTWVQVKGMRGLTHAPQKTDADTTTQDDSGRMTHLPSRRGDQFTFRAFRKEDEANGNKDAGQNALLTLGSAVGSAGIGTFRLTSPGGLTTTFDASVAVTFMGGDEQNASDFQVTLTVTGTLTYI